jgi:hypothetical protein
MSHEPRRRRRVAIVLALSLVIIFGNLALHGPSSGRLSASGASAGPAGTNQRGARPAFVAVVATGSARAAQPSNELVPALTDRVEALTSQPASSDYASVAAVDLTTGARFSYGATGGMPDASISKLDILEALLLAHESSHTTLSAETDELATAMIEHSDNDAGQSLWNGLGSAAAIATANMTLGLTHTVPDPNGYYGLTTSCATDQIALLRDLVSTTGPLDVPSRTYAIGLLDDVEPDQRWGVSAAADAGSTFQVKNGWLALDADNDLWAVNSDGIVTAGGQQLLLSVMTQHNASEQAGIELVESIAKTVASAID